MTDERKIREIYGVKSVLEEAAERTEATWREKLLRETADLRTENALLRAQLDEFNRKLVEATDRNEKIEADCNERVAFIEEKFELDTARLELENNELHAAGVRYLSRAKGLGRQVVQLHAEAEAMVDEIERLRGERDAALKTQADTLLAQRPILEGKPAGPVLGPAVHVARHIDSHQYAPHGRSLSPSLTIRSYSTVCRSSGLPSR